MNDRPSVQLFVKFSEPGCLKMMSVYVDNGFVLLLASESCCRVGFAWWMLLWLSKPCLDWKNMSDLAEQL